MPETSFHLLPVRMDSSSRYFPVCMASMIVMGKDSTRWRRRKPCMPMIQFASRWRLLSFIASCLLSEYGLRLTLSDDLEISEACAPLPDLPIP